MADYESKIAALLRQAEDTNFPEEAKAFFAKAQELMTSMGISEARIRNINCDASDLDIDTLEVTVPGSTSYMAKYTASLLSAVARNNGCKSVWHHTTECAPKRNEKGKIVKEYEQKIWLTGTVNDITRTVELFWNINIQMIRFMVNEKVNGNIPSGVSLQSFNKGFVVMFAETIGARLAEARRSVIKQETEASPDLLPVLANKDQQVMNAYKERWPKLGTARSMDMGAAAGRLAGREAGNSASLGHKSIGSQRELSA